MKIARLSWLNFWSGGFVIDKSITASISDVNVATPHGHREPINSNTQSAAVGEMPMKPARVSSQRYNVSAAPFLISQIGSRIAIQTRELALPHLLWDRTRNFTDLMEFSHRPKKPARVRQRGNIKDRRNISRHFPDSRRVLLLPGNEVSTQDLFERRKAFLFTVARS